jgi:uncharacterized protein YggT (Ycf19 family)
MLHGLFLGVRYFLQIIRYTVLIYLVLSWFMPPNQGFMRFLERIVDPLLRPIRNLLFRFLPRMVIDPSPILFFLLTDLFIRLLWVIFSWLS